jgi:decaprenylphospho-beta-D-erythro-pentofuranosid-2-ulose 2-reductase
MNDAFGHPQSVVVLGGTSEIALAVLRAVAGSRCRSIVLAGRGPGALAEAGARLREGADHLETVHFDAASVEGAAKTVVRCFEAAAEPVDLVLMAVGELGNQPDDESDPDRVTRLLTVNLTWPAAALTEAANQLRRQGHGRIVVLSSVAGYRVRRSTYLYGASKAGLDAFAEGLGESLRGSGVTVHVVRPGFVHTKMTAGRPAAPFTVRPERVGADVARGLGRGQMVIWSPGPLKWMFGALRLVPRSFWRRMPG